MLSLTKVFCYRAIHHSFIRLPPDRIVFLGIIKHGELDIRLAYAIKRRIFISLIIVVLLIIISFSLPRGYLCALVSFRIIIYHRLCGLSFYLWYKYFIQSIFAAHTEVFPLHSCSYYHGNVQRTISWIVLFISILEKYFVKSSSVYIPPLRIAYAHQLTSPKGMKKE